MLVQPELQNNRVFIHCLHTLKNLYKLMRYTRQQLRNAALGQPGNRSQAGPGGTPVATTPNDTHSGDNAAAPPSQASAATKEIVTNSVLQSDVNGAIAAPPPVRRKIRIKAPRSNATVPRDSASPPNHATPGPAVQPGSTSTGTAVVLPAGGMQLPAGSDAINGFMQDAPYSPPQQNVEQAESRQREQGAAPEADVAANAQKRAQPPQLVAQRQTAQQVPGHADAGSRPEAMTLAMTAGVGGGLPNFDSLKRKRPSGASVASGDAFPSKRHIAATQHEASLASGGEALHTQYLGTAEQVHNMRSQRAGTALMA
jgi:hypothetical protein